MGEIYYRDRNEGKFDKNGKKKKPNWEYRFEAAPINGKRKKIEKSGFARKQDAVNASILAYDEYMNSGERIQPSTMSFADCLDHWMENYVALQCKENTYINYEKSIRLYIKPVLGRYRLGSISTASLQRMLNKLVEQKYSLSVIANVKGICTKCLRYAKRNNWVRYNNAIDMDMPSPNAQVNLRKKERYIFSKEEIQRIFERFPKSNNAYTPLILAYRAGLRKGEVYGLTWNDVDFENGTIDINKQMQFSHKDKIMKIIPPKYNSYRVIDLDNDTMQYLQALKEKQQSIKAALGEDSIQMYVDENGLVNDRGDGNEINFINLKINGSCLTPSALCHYFEIIHKELKIPQGDFHSLRHTHATELASKGLHLKEIQRRLGHKNESTTMRTYVHATQEMRTQAITILNSMYDTEAQNSGGTTGARSGLPPMNEPHNSTTDASNDV